LPAAGKAARFHSGVRAIKLGMQGCRATEAQCRHARPARRAGAQNGNGRRGGGLAMIRKLLIAGSLALAAALFAAVPTAPAAAFGSEFSGPGPMITGNNTGGIFPYRPAVPGTYDEIAESFCARYGRLAKVTSIHPVYGDYVSFVCYDRRGRIH
jgi:hypothetical protein